MRFRYMLKSSMFLALCIASSGQAAPHFITAPAAGLEVSPEVGAGYVNRDVDWVRRVHVDSSALMADRLLVDLFDETVELIRQPAEMAEDESPTPLYVPDIHGAMTILLPPAKGPLWSGCFADDASRHVPGCRSSDVDVREYSQGELHLSILRGHFVYELKGDVLSRRDLRRLPDEGSVRDPIPGHGPTVFRTEGDDAESVIRIAVGYGNQALDDGRDVVIDEVAKAIKKGNDGFSGSGVKLRIKRAANALPGYRESSTAAYSGKTRQWSPPSIPIHPDAPAARRHEPALLAQRDLRQIAGPRLSA